MRKLYTLLSCALLALPAMADEPQLPNSSFEDNWHDCIPWTSADNTATQGTTPDDWTISNTVGTGSLGKTTVGEKVEGYNSPSAVKIENKQIKVLFITQTIPGYFALGTTWSTSNTNKDNDGGTFGGYAFTGRPDKITFMYKFTRNGENTQPANAIAYLWKGTFKQADVPGNIGLGTTTKVEMVNRDRNILGMETAQGGAVTEQGTLIAKGITTITETSADWVKGEIVFEYLTEDTPEMINVIFAANDYFDSSNIAAGNALTVDKVECVYPVKEEPGETLIYTGPLNIYMNGATEDANNGESASVEITETSATTCNFTLPNFNLQGIQVGDIKVDNVTTTTENGVTTYKGHVDDLILYLSPQFPIHASVDLNGTTDSEGNAHMDIDVVWHSGDPSMGDNGEVPIKCVFNGQLKTNGIGSIVADDENAPVELYNLSGVRVSADSAAPGLYIRRQGSKVSKVIIR